APQTLDAPLLLPGRTALPRALPTWARPDLDRGRLDPALPLEHVRFVLSLTPAQRADRDRLLRAQEDPTSPSFHRWLTPEAYAARFGPSPADIDELSSWLTSQGLAVEGLSRAHLHLSFSGTVAQLEKAFATELHTYAVDGVRHFAPTIAPSLPSAFAGRVLSIQHLHDAAPRARPRPDYLTGAGLALAPSDWATIYDVDKLYAAGLDGTGQKIAVVGQTYYYPADLAAFRSTFQLPAKAPIDLFVPGSGSASYIGGANDVTESELDLEWASAIAKNADVVFVYTGGAQASNGVLDAIPYAIEEDVAPVVAITYGLGCDGKETAADADTLDAYASAANLLGITVVAASGDTGAAGCYDFGPNASTPMPGLSLALPSSLPNVTVVGGTEFPPSSQTSSYWNDAGAALAYIPYESGWDDSAQAGFPFAGGGGKSTIFAKPYWQEGVTPSDGARDAPDLALAASPYETGYWIVSQAHSPSGFASGGTSASAPTFAAVLALVNQALVKNGGTAGLGNANPMLYALAASTPSAFHDITAGENVVPCKAGDKDCPSTAPYTYGYTASAGFDLVTGLGSIDAYALVTAWSALAPTTTTLDVTPKTTSEGNTVTLTAHVGSNAASPAMGGTVSFAFETYTAPDGGAFDESWVIATATVVPATSGGQEIGTATVTAAVPPGVFGVSDVVASYDGDAHFLASRSTKVRVATPGVVFTASPSSATLAPGGAAAFTSSGGVPPIRWAIVTDTTCTPSAPTCSTLDASGSFRAGELAGIATLHAIDADGAETPLVTVTVASPPDAGPPPSDSGVDASPPDAADTGPADATAPPTDAPAPAEDASTPPPPTSPGGCGCRTTPASPSPVAPLAPAATALAAAFLLRRRPRRRSTP
ncbi:MAG TPA: protease pro-enzyme activation domain-containing protein, partial [Polyangiaceae bacterium]